MKFYVIKKSSIEIHIDTLSVFIFLICCFEIFLAHDGFSLLLLKKQQDAML